MQAQTGSRRVVCNVWSDAARQASAQARRSGATGRMAGTEDLDKLATAVHEHTASKKAGVGKKLSASEHLEQAGRHSLLAEHFQKKGQLHKAKQHTADAEAHRYMAKGHEHKESAVGGFTKEIGIGLGGAIAAEAIKSSLGSKHTEEGK